MVTNPVTASPDNTLTELDALSARYRISGAPVVDADGVLLGIVTNRDMRFETDYNRLVRDVMTPMPLVKSSILRPSPSVTYEPSPLVMTASTTRPRPFVTCFLPNCTKDSCDCVDVDAMLRFWPE